MRIVSVILLLPFLATGQINPVFIVKANLAYTQLDASGDGMFGFEKDGKYGYMDKDEKIVIPAIYEFTGGFVHTIPRFIRGHVVVRKDIKYAILDKTGKITTPLEFGSLDILASLPNHILISRRPDGRQLYGICTFDNKLIIPMDYQEFIADSNMIIAKQNNKYGLFDLDGKMLIPVEYNSLTAFPKDGLLKAEKDGKYGIVDNKGNWLFTKEKSVYELLGASEGMIRCKVNNKYGFLDRKGNEVIMTKYDYAANFESNGLAKVGNKSAANSTVIFYGYIDKKGNEVIPLKHDIINTFSNGLLLTKDPETNRYGFLDKSGKWMVKPAYLSGNNFDEFGGAWMKMTDAKDHYIDKTGKDYGVFNEASFKNFNKDGYAVNENTNNSYLLIDKTGKVLKKIDECETVYAFSDGMAGYRSRSNSKYGFIDMNGNKIAEAEYDGFAAFENGITKVDKKVDNKNKSGYINNKGNIIIPIVYESASVMRDGWGIIKKDSNYFFIDKNGNLREPTRKYNELYEFRSGFALGKINGKGTDPHTYFYINPQLKEEFSIQAKQAYLFWEDVAIVSRDNTTYELMNKKGQIFKTLTGIQTVKFCVDGMLAVKENNKWGFINSKGDMIVKAKYDSCESFKYGYGRVKMGGKWGIIDRSGTEIINPKYDNILSGENGLFIFMDKYWGVIDRTGKILIPPGYWTINIFEKDRAVAKFGKTYTILKSPLAK